jgi:hypothetical protein
MSDGTYSSCGYANWPLLCLYGALTPAQRQAVLAGQTVPYTALNEQARAFARSAAGARYNVYRGATGVPPPAWIGDLSEEPTESCPDGLPPAPRGVRAHQIGKTLVYFLGPGATERERTFWRMDAAEQQTVRIFSGPPPRVPQAGFSSIRYEVHHQESITIEIDATPWNRLGVEFDEDPGPPLGPAVPLSKLPADLRKAVTKEIDFIRQLAGPQPRPRTDGPR